MLVNKAVAMRISKLLKEKNMTQYRLEQNSGILHMEQWLALWEKETKLYPCQP